LFERPRSGERAVLVHLNLPDHKDQEDLPEFTELARSAGAEPADTVSANRTSPDPKYFVGAGKAREIRDRVADGSAELVLFNHALTPSQERNLEQLFQCRVLDRTGLILDIFAQRARSFEGKLQVELAQLRHLSTRLVRGWTHLERQKGGIGLRGPGETQLETDRRLIGGRIKLLNRRLEKVRRQRHQGRRARTRAELPTVSLVGYTNAGKSTLFNGLTGASVMAADQLFATLDPTLRRLDLSEVGPVVLADTVGFIRHLPHDLVAAFRSTLEETLEAQLLLHVIDAGDEQRHSHMEQVRQVLAEIGAGGIPQLEIYNKIDLAGQEPRIERDGQGRIRRVWLSAHTGDGLELLTQAIAEHFRGRMARGWLRVPPSAGRLRARLYGVGTVLDERVDDHGNCWLKLRMAQRELDQLCRGQGLECSLTPEVRGDFLAGLDQGP